jgi:hypothetical protein
MNLLFVLLVVVGFAAMFMSTFPSPPYMARVAWGCWLVASLIWAVTTLGLHTA